MSAEQNEDVKLIAGHVKGNAVLDYVTLWYFLAVKYTNGNPSIRCAFVSTNSVTQGEQVSVLWGVLFAAGIVIHFGHRTFSWMSEARGKAHVHVVIVGFGRRDVNGRHIVDYETDDAGVRTNSTKINAYLVDGPNVLVPLRSNPISNNAPDLSFGSMPNEAKPPKKLLVGLAPDEIARRTADQLTLDSSDRVALIAEEPRAEKGLRPIMGSHEFINGIERWCLWLADVPPSELRTMPAVLRRTAVVKENRLLSTRAETKALAATPWLFGENRQPKTRFLAIPKTSSERRRYIPIGFLEPTVIANTELFTIPGATLYHFGVLTSAMHMAWVRTVCGRLKSDYRYSSKLVYNNYPWPLDVTGDAKAKVEKAAQRVLETRAALPGQTLADLYHPEVMPPALIKAHHTLDAAVDKCYRRETFKSDRDRVEYLFALYETLATPLMPAVKAKHRRAET